MFMNRWHQSTEGDWTHKNISMSHWIHKPHFSRQKSTWQNWEEKNNFGFGDLLCAGKHSGAVTRAGLFELGRWYGIRENIEMSFMQIERCPDLLENPQSLFKTVAFLRSRPSLVYSIFKVGSPSSFTSISKQNRLPEALGGLQTGKRTQNDAKLLLKGILQSCDGDNAKRHFA